MHAWRRHATRNLILACLTGLTPGALSAQAAPLTEIAFGSCSDVEEPLPIFQTIADDRPDLFIFTGDNVYADTEDMVVMWSHYARLDAHPGFAALRSQTEVIGTWDDHDYGVNDGGAEYPARREAQDVFMRFFRVPEDSPMRTRDGVYDAHLYGPEGQRVQVILLDTRFFRGPLTRRDPDVDYGMPGRYIPSTDASLPLLGEEQWAWLEEQLHVPAEVRIVISSIQLVSEEHGFEKWANLPHERTRFLDLLRDTGAEGVMILSGDRHFTQVSRIPADDPQGIGYPLFDITASALSRRSGRDYGEPNRYRVGEDLRENNYGRITIVWDPDDPTLTVDIVTVSGEVARRHTIPLSTLRRTNPPE